MKKTLQEILFQPRAWQKTIDSFEKKKTEITEYLMTYQDAELVFTGCGTSYYLSLIAANLYTRLDQHRARGVPASEINLYPEAVFSRGQKYFLIPISRSGKTAETLDAMSYFKKEFSTGRFLITCTAESEMSNLSEKVFVCPAAAEETKYMTKSFTSMLLVWQLIIAHKIGNKTYQAELIQLPFHGERLLKRFRSYCEKLASDHDFTVHVYLGHGPLYGIAAESMLKLTEMAGTPAVVYHGMEFMHGPKYAVNDRTLIIYFLSDSAKKQEIDLLKKIRKFDAKIAVLCDETGPEITELADFVICLNSGFSDYSRLILTMLFSQLYAYYRALARGEEID
jgi:glucosamine--fructose-6-phosphate aminotransferase (isomerizing)